jgi:hypothetical protein
VIGALDWDGKGEVVAGLDGGVCACVDDSEFCCASSEEESKRSNRAIVAIQIAFIAIEFRRTVLLFAEVGARLLGLVTGLL